MNLSVWDQGLFFYSLARRILPTLDPRQSTFTAKNCRPPCALRTPCSCFAKVLGICDKEHEMGSCLSQGEDWAHIWWQDSNAQAAFLGTVFLLLRQVHCWSKLYYFMHSPPRPPLHKLCRERWNLQFSNIYKLLRPFIFAKQTSSQWFIVEGLAVSLFFEHSRYIFLKHSSSTWLQLRLIWVEMSVKNHKVRSL